MEDKDLIEHGLAIKGLTIVVEENGKKLDLIFGKLDKIPELDKRVVVLETNAKNQPSARKMLTFSSIGGGISFAALWIFKKLI